jgi:hypothetical protein
VLLQKHLHLFLEGHLPVVFRLVLDVFRRVLDARYADAERAITFLPLKIPVFFRP